MVGRVATTFAAQPIDLRNNKFPQICQCPHRWPAKWRLLMDILGRSMTNTRIRSDSRDDVAIAVFALFYWEAYNVYEIVSEYTLCAPISSSMRS
jgi:hypothetical protein